MRAKVVRIEILECPHGTTVVSISDPDGGIRIGPDCCGRWRVIRWFKAEAREVIKAVRDYAYSEK